MRCGAMRSNAVQLGLVLHWQGCAVVGLQGHRKTRLFSRELIPSSPPPPPPPPPHPPPPPPPHLRTHCVYREYRYDEPLQNEEQVGTFLADFFSDRTVQSELQISTKGNTLVACPPGGGVSEVDYVKLVSFGESRAEHSRVEPSRLDPYAVKQELKRDRAGESKQSRVEQTLILSTATTLPTPFKKSTKTLSMKFFDKMQSKARLVTDSGYIRKCLDEVVEGVTCTDLLCQMFISEESEHIDLYSDEEKAEFVFHLLRRLVVGGSLSQSEVCCVVWPSQPVRTRIDYSTVRRISCQPITSTGHVGRLLGHVQGALQALCDGRKKSGDEEAAGPFRRVRDQVGQGPKWI